MSTATPPADRPIGSRSASAASPVSPTSGSGVPTAQPAGARSTGAPGNRRDRHGRGLRRPLITGRVPLFRSRSQRFDDAVLRAVDDLEELFGRRLESLEFAVDEVPPVNVDGRSSVTVDAVLDGGVPLTRFVPPGVDRRGRPTRARVIIYRRPVEHRSTDPEDLEDLIVDLLREQVVAILGEPDQQQ